MKNDFNLRADLHLHSHTGLRLWYCPLLYDSVQSVETILARALELGLDILSITDHDSLAGYLKAQKIINEENLNLTLVPGIEISSKDGHVLAYGVDKVVEPGLTAAETVKRIHQLGGIAIAAHPYNPLALKDKILEVDFDAIEVFNSQTTQKANAKSLAAAKNLGLPCFAGSDAHQVEQIGSCLLYFPESTGGWRDVVENIKKGNFKTSTARTDLVEMSLRHLKRNFEIQILKRRSVLN